MQQCVLTPNRNLKLGQIDVDNEKTKTNLNIKRYGSIIHTFFFFNFIFKIQLCLDYFR